MNSKVLCSIAYKEGSTESKAKTAHAARYSVDLAGHLSSCEMNYHRFIKLVPDLLLEREQWSFDVGYNDVTKVNIHVVQLAAYTSTVEVIQSCPVMTIPSMIVRLYHDANVCEIISWDGHRNIRPQYDYPNPNMYLPNEKQALSQFLADWLAFCHTNGQVKLKNCEAVLDSEL